MLWGWQVIEIYDGTITISDPVFSQTIQYSDGRQEIINVPKAFTVGDMVAVTHRRDGGVVVQRVSPFEEGYAEILSSCPTWEAGQSIRARGTFGLLSAWMPGSSGLEFSIICDSGDPIFQTVMITNSYDLGTLTTGDIIPDASATSVWVYVKVWIGAYSRMNNVQYSVDGGGTWNYVMDGDVSAGGFAASNEEGWYRVPPGVGATYSLEGEILFI